MASACWGAAPVQSPRLQPTGKSWASPPPIRSPPRAGTQAAPSAREAEQESRRKANGQCWNWPRRGPGSPLTRHLGVGGEETPGGEGIVRRVTFPAGVNSGPFKSEPSRGLPKGCRAPAKVRSPATPFPRQPALWLGSDSNSPLGVPKGAGFLPTEHRDSDAGEKASPSLPQSTTTKTITPVSLPLPQPSGKRRERGSDARGPVLPRRSPPRRLQKNLQPVGATGHVPTRSWPGRGAREPGRRREVSGRIWRGKLCRVLAAADANSGRGGCGPGGGGDGTRPAATLSPAPRREHSAPTRRPSVPRAPAPSPLRALFLSQDSSSSPGHSASSLRTHSHPQIKSPLLNPAIPGEPSH